jgi:hypothetical protein
MNESRDKAVIKIHSPNIHPKTMPMMGWGENHGGWCAILSPKTNRLLKPAQTIDFYKIFSFNLKKDLYVCGNI